MGIFKSLTNLVLLFVVNSAVILMAEPARTSRVFYLIHSGHYEDAIRIYQEEYARKNQQSFDVLQQIGLGILKEGSRSKDPEILLLTLFGAAISNDEQALRIIEDGLDSPHPQLQLAALNLLAQNQNDTAEDAMKSAMSSQYLPIRLEAIYLLAARQNPVATIQAECLMYKVPEAAQPLFPQIFAMASNEQATKLLKRLLSHSSIAVRIAAITSCAKFGRDDMLPRIRLLSSHLNFTQQEACASALGLMKDEASATKLEQMSRSKNPEVSLASLQALYRLGRLDTRQKVEKLALNGDLFAIRVLGEMPGSEAVLLGLMKNNNIHIRINAALALLERNHPGSLSGLIELLIRDHRDLAFTPVESSGHAFSALRAISSASHLLKDNPLADEISTGIRENILVKARALPEKDFLALADYLLEKQQADLISVLIRLVEEIDTSNSIALLKKHQQKFGAPLVRHYCNLALYRLKQQGPYGENLRAWVKEKKHLDLISFRPMVPWEMRTHLCNYQLTPKETSRLLVEAFEAFASQQDEQGIDVLVDAILNGNPKNKYALAGLLIRATQ